MSSPQAAWEATEKAEPPRPMVGARHGFQRVLVIAEGNQPGINVTITDLHGEILIEHTRPAPGITYVGNRRPRGPGTTTDVSPIA